MDSRRYSIRSLAGLIICFSFLFSDAQPSVKTSVDKNEILIGEQLKLRVELDFPGENYNINWFVIHDSLGHFELIEKTRIDSLISNDKVTGITQTFTLTSFDSGKWPLPSFNLKIESGDHQHLYNLQTDSLPITVSFSASDTSRELRDIKPIKEADRIDTTWYWIAAGILLVLLIIFLIWFYKHWKKKRYMPLLASKLSPYEEAMQELEKLKQTDLSVPGEIKIYHTRLATLFKRYLTRKQNRLYLNNTTGDMLLLLSNNDLNKDMLTKAATSLRCGDAVKFARYIPPVTESQESLQSIKEIINFIEQQTV